MILISNDFWHKIKIDHFDPHNALLVIATFKSQHTGPADQSEPIVLFLREGLNKPGTHQSVERRRNGTVWNKVNYVKNNV